MMNYKVYVHIFPNGKKYVGISRQKTKKRWQNGKGYQGQFVYNAILKYGWNNIKHEILYTNLTKEEAENTEINLIKIYRSNEYKYGYNIAKGGNCQESVSDQTKRKISLLKKGKKRPPDVIKKMQEGHKNYKMSEENKNKMSKRLKLQYLGEGNPFYGKKHTIETKRKMSQKRKGKLNANYGKGKPVICIETKIIYNNIREAQEKTNISSSNIGKCCNKKLKSAGKLHWEFYKEMI